MLTPTLHRDDHWLRFDAVATRSDAADREELLAWNGELPGNCKFARAAWRGPIRVRAELPLALESETRVAEVHSGFATAASRLGSATGPAARESSSRTLAAASPDLAGLCREAGWPFEERSDGSLAVDLGAQGRYLPALACVHGEGIAVEAELVRRPEAEGPCRSALAELLLRVNGAFRMVRAALREPGPRALLELWLPLTADAEELRLAFDALAVAARRSASEARLLASDEGIARAYLERDALDRNGRSGTAPLARGR